MITLRDRFLELAYARISQIKLLIPMSNKPVMVGESYTPLWRQMSANWVAMHGNPRTLSICLETICNHQDSTTDGYRAAGSNLATAAHEYPKVP